MGFWSSLLSNRDGRKVAWHAIVSCLCLREFFVSQENSSPHFVFLMLLGSSPAGFHSLLLASQIRRMLAYFNSFLGFKQPLINGKLMFWNVIKIWETEHWGYASILAVSKCSQSENRGQNSVLRVTSRLPTGVQRKICVGVIFSLPAHWCRSKFLPLMTGVETGSC